MFNDNDVYVGLEHLISGGGLKEYANSAGLKSAKTVFRAGDVLYGKLRPCLNKHVLVDFDGVCSTDILALRSSDYLEPIYLESWISTPMFIRKAVEDSKGVNLPRVSFKSIAEYPLALPPIEEQKEISRILDSALARVERVNELVALAVAQLAAMKRQLVAAALAGKLQ